MYYADLLRLDVLASYRWSAVAVYFLDLLISDKFDTSATLYRDKGPVAVKRAAIGILTQLNVFLGKA